MLQVEKGASPLHFSVSHSGDYALLGFSRTQVLGVDLEKMEAQRAWRDILNKHFDADENAYVREGGGETEQARRFYRLWTLKEAWIKCEGTGLFKALEEVHLPTELLEEGPAFPAQGCSLLPIDLPRLDYAGALAVQGELREVSACQATPDQILACP